MTDLYAATKPVYDIPQEDWHTEDYAQPYCREGSGTWVCTRPEGHGGPHVAARYDYREGRLGQIEWLQAWYSYDPDLGLDRGL